MPPWGPKQPWPAHWRARRPSELDTGAGAGLAVAGAGLAAAGTVGVAMATVGPAAGALAGLAVAATAGAGVAVAGAAPALGALAAPALGALAALLRACSCLRFLSSSATRLASSCAARWLAIVSAAPLDSVSLSGAEAVGFFSSTWACTLPPDWRAEVVAAGAAGRPSASRRRNSLKSRLCATRVCVASDGETASACSCEGRFRTAPERNRLTLAPAKASGLDRSMATSIWSSETVVGLLAAAILPAVSPAWTVTCPPWPAAAGVGRAAGAAGADGAADGAWAEGAGRVAGVPRAGRDPGAGAAAGEDEGAGEACAVRGVWP
jgi:hypothetical protein